MTDVHREFGLFIDGGWDGGWTRGTRGAAAVLSPVTEQPIGAAPVATRADTEAAIAAAGASPPGRQGRPSRARTRCTPSLTR